LIKEFVISNADPVEMLHFLSAAKIKLIKSIRNHPDTVTNIAKVIKRDRSSVNRDILELKKFGLVKIHEEVNPGCTRHTFTMGLFACLLCVLLSLHVQFLGRSL
jgi:predicted transcriptional regulator